jgi:hypothetical protein
LGFVVLDLPFKVTVDEFSIEVFVPSIIIEIYIIQFSSPSHCNPKPLTSYEEMFVIKDGYGCINTSPLLTMGSPAVVEYKVATNEFDRNCKGFLTTNTSDFQALKRN